MSESDDGDAPEPVRETFEAQAAPAARGGSMWVGIGIGIGVALAAGGAFLYMNKTLTLRSKCCMGSEAN